MSKTIAIVGPTASGKTALALRIAADFNGEIIAADSRTVYRHLDIGTAKPTTAEQTAVRHHLVDVVDPGEPFTVADFQHLATTTMANISARGKLSLLVGGTGLYVDSVLYGYEFPTDAVDSRRSELATLSVSELQAKVDNLGIDLNPSDYQNPRRLIRALETAGSPRTRHALRPETLVLGMQVPRDILRQRIEARVHQMLDAGFIDEVRRVGEQYGFESEAFTGIGYRAFAGVVQGDKSVEQATREFVQGDVQLAKRQVTWFKRNPDITWVDDADTAMASVRNFMAS